MDQAQSIAFVEQIVNSYCGGVGYGHIDREFNNAVAKIMKDYCRAILSPTLDESVLNSWPMNIKLYKYIVDFINNALIEKGIPSNEIFHMPGNADHATWNKMIFWIFVSGEALKTLSEEQFNAVFAPEKQQELIDQINYAIQTEIIPAIGFDPNYDFSFLDDNESNNIAPARAVGPYTLFDVLMQSLNLLERLNIHRNLASGDVKAMQDFFYLLFRPITDEQTIQAEMSRWIWEARMAQELCKIYKEISECGTVVTMAIDFTVFAGAIALSLVYTRLPMLATYYIWSSMVGWLISEVPKIINMRTLGFMMCMTSTRRAMWYDRLWDVREIRK